MALLAAARRAGEAGWEREALAIARAAAERPEETAGVVDAGLCHGAAGVAHLFHRLFQATGDPTLERAAVAWYDRTLALRRSGAGIGGFLAWDPDATGAMGWRPTSGFLSGAAGVGLALLAGLTPVEPEWDRALQAAIPGPADQVGKAVRRPPSRREGR